LTDTAQADGVALARRAFDARPSGLFVDFDGTLSWIVREPTAARLVPGAAEALTALARRLAVICIVTGRAAADARRLIGLDDVWVAGNHGIEYLAPGSTEVERPAAVAGGRQQLERLLAAVPPVPGLWIEDKELSATVHYRRTADPAAARSQVVAALSAALSGHAIELREGRMSVEMRPAGLGDKGTAVRTLVDRFGLRGVVVIGDDLTDLDMFRVASQLRRNGLVAALLGVGGNGEVPRAVEDAADAMLPDPPAVAALLAQL
jgi:trehalose 6-phosphate phosphatase